MPFLGHQSSRGEISGRAATRVTISRSHSLPGEILVAVLLGGAPLTSSSWLHRPRRQIHSRIRRTINARNMNRVNKIANICDWDKKLLRLSFTVLPIVLPGLISESIWFVRIGARDVRSPNGSGTWANVPCLNGVDPRPRIALKNYI